MPLEAIATYNAGRGYGFISPIKTDGSDGDSEDLFFHVSAFDDGVKILCGERVGYETAPSRSQYGVEPGNGRQYQIHLTVAFLRGTSKRDGEAPGRCPISDPGLNSKRSDQNANRNR